MINQDLFDHWFWLLRHNLSWFSIPKHQERIETLTSVLFIRYPYSSFFIRCPMFAAYDTNQNLNIHQPGSTTSPNRLVHQSFRWKTANSYHFEPLLAIMMHCLIIINDQTLLDKPWSNHNWSVSTVINPYLSWFLLLITPCQLISANQLYQLLGYQKQLFSMISWLVC